MGKKVTCVNNTDKIKHVGPITIWPGGAREVDVDHMEAKERAKYLPDAPAKAVPEPPAILALLELSIANFAAAIAEHDDGGAFKVSAEQLQELDKGEQTAKHPRKGIAEAIAAELLARSDAAVNAEDLAKALAAMDLQELHDQFDVYKDDAGTLAIVENVWRAQLNTLTDEARLSLMETLAADSRQLAILNEVIAG